MSRKTRAWLLLAVMAALFLLPSCAPAQTKLTNAPEKLSIVGPYGDDEAYHPKALYFENGWNGYTYWLSYTPYPHADDTKEDPCIACSNDLKTWTTPNGLVNPLSKRDNERGYNSDAHILYNHDRDQLECWWRYVDDEGEVESAVIYRVTSADGAHWSEKEAVLTAENRKQSDWVSPAILYEDGIYKFWYVTHRTVYYMETVDLRQWSEPIHCDVKAEDDTRIWHIDVIHTDLGYEMLSVNYKNDAPNHHGMKLYYTYSKDETTWDVTSRAIMEPGKNANAWDAKGLYRSTFLKRADSYDILYSAYGNDGERGVALLRDVTIPKPPVDLSPLVGIGFLLALLAVGAVVYRGYTHAGPNGRLGKLKRHQFLFEELVKRDFKKKYKRTVLGMTWSVLSPLLTLLVMRLVFTQLFGRNTPHYTTYLFCGNLIFAYFNESTTQGMTALRGNAGIFTKVNVPKYLFLLSKNVQTLINFGLTMVVFVVFCCIDHITFTWKFVCLIYPVVMLLLFNIGVGLILSALFIFFRDIQYLWSVFTMLLMYMSAIFYTIDRYPPAAQNLFLLNPVYLFIRYFRKIVIDATIPSVWFHLLMLADVIIAVGVGCFMYKKNNTKFLYYV